MISFRELLTEKKIDFKEFVNKVIDLGADAFDAIPADKIKTMKDADIVKVVVMAAMKKDKDVKAFWVNSKEKDLVDKVAKALQL